MNMLEEARSITKSIYQKFYDIFGKKVSSYDLGKTEIRDWVGQHWALLDGKLIHSSAPLNANTLNENNYNWAELYCNSRDWTSVEVDDLTIINAGLWFYIVESKLRTNVTKEVETIFYGHRKNGNNKL